VSLLGTSACGFLGGGGPEVGLSYDPHETTIAQLRSFVKTGLVPCRTLIERYQLLHDSLDADLHAVVTWNDQVLAAADRLDQVPYAQRGSLHCVPLVVKDNFDFAGLPTTGGATALADAITGNTADAVQRLVSAGAIVLGKSNMPDFALDGTNTKSSYGGQTQNPYNPALTVYGSSGGTAAAITASLGILGLGTDTSGSLVQPASATGLVAIRPTQGLVSITGTGTGVLPLMSLQDAAGPMTRTVADAAAALELLVDAQKANLGPQGYTASLSADGLHGIRIGFDPASLQQMDMPSMLPSPEVVALFNQTLNNLGTAGATTVQVNALSTLLPSLQQAASLSFQCMPVDFKQSLNTYLATLRPEAKPRTLADIIASGGYSSDAAGFLNSAQAQTDTIQSSAACQQYLTARMAASAAVTQFMDQAGIDLLLYPAANQPPFAIGTPPAGWFGFHILSSVTGLPSLTMPMGVAASEHAPVGFILLARGYQEVKLIQAAHTYELRFSPRKAPQ
jgi:Asp-tRNA(Asn)/Glu-tRNA(Gln) amidotransferase A subunit family amidase